MVSVMSQNQCCLYYLSSNYTSLCVVCQWGLNNFGRNLFLCCFEVWKTSKLPAGQTFRKESYKVFSYFLYFTKSRKKPAAGRRKDLSLFVRSRHCDELNRGLQNLEAPFGKGFNFVSGKLLFGCADSRFVKPRISFWEGFNFVSAKLLFGWVDSRFAKPQCSLQGERFYSFRLYEKNQKYPKGCGPLDSRGRFKSPLDSWVSLK